MADHTTPIDILGMKDTKGVNKQYYNKLKIVNDDKAEHMRIRMLNYKNKLLLRKMLKD